MNSNRLAAWLLTVLIFTAPAAGHSSRADEKSDATAKPKSNRADWAEIKLTGSYPESQQMPGLFGELTEGLATCLDRLDQAARDKSLKGVILHIDGVDIGF